MPKFINFNTFFRYHIIIDCDKDRFPITVSFSGTKTKDIPIYCYFSVNKELPFEKECLLKFREPKFDINLAAIKDSKKREKVEGKITSCNLLVVCPRPCKLLMSCHLFGIYICCFNRFR